LVQMAIDELRAVVEQVRVARRCAVIYRQLQEIKPTESASDALMHQMLWAAHEMKGWPPGEAP
jgi:hypothetical protein